MDFTIIASLIDFMSKTHNTELYDLIRSMTKSEKRHFKIYASRHVIGDENKYVKLFDAIERQKIYDEKLLAKNESYISQLPLLKKRLYSAVMKSLTLFHSSIDSEICLLLHQAEILYEKALYLQALKLLGVAEEMATTHELPVLELETLRWKTKIAWARDRMDDITGILKREAQLLTKITNARDFRTINHKIFTIYYKRGVPRDIKQLKELRKIVRHPILRTPNKADSFESLHTFYHFHTIYYLMCQDNRKAYGYALKKLELFDDAPGKIKTFTNFYLGDINDCLIFSLTLKDFKLMESYIQKLRNLENSNLSLRNRTILFFYAYHELNYYNSTGQFEKATERIEQLETQLIEYGIKITPAKRAVLFITFAVAFFSSKNYKKSLYYLNEARNNPLGGVRTDIESFAHLFYLIVHYEKGSDRILLQSLIRSTYRFLLKRNHLFELEKCILDFIRKRLIKVRSEKELLASLGSLKAEIERVIRNPRESGTLQDFDFVAWLESKISGRSFSEVVKLRNQVSF